MQYNNFNNNLNLIDGPHVKKLEKQIREIPEYYYWTHNRFKHKDKAPRN